MSCVPIRKRRFFSNPTILILLAVNFMLLILYNTNKCQLPALEKYRYDMKTSKLFNINEEWWCSPPHPDTLKRC